MITISITLSILLLVPKLKGSVPSLVGLLALPPLMLQSQVLDYEKISRFDQPFQQVNIHGDVKTITADYYKITVDSLGNAVKELTNPSIYTGNIEYTQMDSLGRVVTEATIFNGQLDEQVAYRYSKNSDTVVMTIKYSSGRIIWEVVFIFSKENLLVEATESFHYPKLPVKRHMIYYNQDNHIDSIAVISQDQQVRNLKYQYFEKDSFMRKEYKNGSFRGDIATFMFDPNGKLESINYAGTDFLDKHAVHYKYDSYGNVIEHLFSGGVGLALLPFRDDDTTLIEYEYVYDELGNWIVQEMTVNGSLYQITERRIEYEEE